MSESIDHSIYRAAYNPDFLQRARERRRKDIEAQRRDERLRIRREAASKAREVYLEKKADLAARLKEVGLREKRASSILKEAQQVMEKARERLHQVELYDNHVSSFDKVARRICRVFGYSKAELLSAQRGRRLSLARQAVFYWVARRTKMSLPQIGERLNRDHTTALYSRTRYVERRAAMGRTLRHLPKGKR